MIMNLKGGNIPACASCKYQRRKCAPNCILAPFFPANETKAFQNAHRLFGVANIIKILRMVTKDQREEAVRSIKYEADIREKFPVHGCLGIISQLWNEIKETEEQLLDVYEQLNVYRGEKLYYRPISASDIYYPPAPVSSDLRLGITNYSHIQICEPTPQSSGTEIPILLSINDYDDESHSHQFFLEENNSIVGVEQSHYGFSGHYNNSIHNWTAPSNIYQNFQNEMYTSVTDDQQSYIDTREAGETSSVSHFREFQPPT